MTLQCSRGDLAAVTTTHAVASPAAFLLQCSRGELAAVTFVALVL